MVPHFLRGSGRKCPPTHHGGTETTEKIVNLRAADFTDYADFPSAASLRSPATQRGTHTKARSSQRRNRIFWPSSFVIPFGHLGTVIWGRLTQFKSEIGELSSGLLRCFAHNDGPPTLQRHTRKHAHQGGSGAWTPRTHPPPVQHLSNVASTSDVLRRRFMGRTLWRTAHSPQRRCASGADWVRVPTGSVSPVGALPKRDASRLGSLSYGRSPIQGFAFLIPPAP